MLKSTASCRSVRPYSFRSNSSYRNPLSFRRLMDASKMILFRSPFGVCWPCSLVFYCFLIISLVSVGTLLLYFCNILAGVQVIMFTYGILTSWFYLRFLQAHVRHSVSGTNRSAAKTITRGDLSESFAFDTLFPSFIRPPVTVVCNVIFRTLSIMKCCSRILRQDGSTSSTQNGTVKTNYQYRPLLQDDTVQNI